MQQQTQRLILNWVAVGQDTVVSDNGHIMNSANGITWSNSVGGDAFNTGRGVGIAYGTSGDGTSMWVAVGR